jgi:putative phage-type endonuclease
MEQRSNEWFNQRLGRFTASRISDLLGVKGLGLTGESYAFKLATEIVFGREQDQLETWDMKRGNELEPVAFELFKSLHEFENIQESKFFPYGDNAGASPDGLVGLDAILEIKCPRSEKFFKLVAEGEKAIDKGYVAQMQMQMMCTNSQRAYFFNYIEYNGVPMYHEIIVERDEKMINLIKERIEEATVIRDEYVQYLLNNKQF